MRAPPPNSGNWENFGPRRVFLDPSHHTHVRRRRARPMSDGDWNEMRTRLLVGRRETPSGIEGLTFDYAGRPV